VVFLTAEVDADSRLRTSYNVAGTETGRWSSSTNAFGSGTNLQNFPEKLRSVFVADEGRKLAYLDLEQAESWVVGIKLWELFADDRYIRAIEEGDLHTSVARMVWPQLGWTG
jgi:DNA polymerase I-like protein with 3'-5' exonuclease and polymerase domains